MAVDPIMLGKIIQEFRSAKGLSQEGLAAFAGLSRAYVGQVERGEVSVSVVALAQIAEGLNISMVEVFDRYERNTRKG